MNNLPKELELKYSIESFNIIEVLEAMTKQGYIIFKGRGLENVDEYYDTKNRDFLNIGASLRTRTIKTEDSISYKATFKTPISFEHNYVDRIEIEKEIQKPTYQELLKELEGIPFDLTNICPAPYLTVKTKRFEVYLEKEESTICLSFDEVTYINKSNKTKNKENIIEVELGDDSNPELLNETNEILTSNLDVTIIKDNKYKRGLIRSLTK